MQPVGVIGELIEDGEEVEGRTERREPGMLRRDGCLRFGKKWGLKVCTIEDLATYIEKSENLGKSTNGTNGAIKAR
jgi:3,4-dihydroxy 2-butanone 4-phosphate synthase